MKHIPSNSGGFATRLQPFVDRRELAGAVMLVARSDKIVAVDTVGYADVEARTPMRPDTLFWIASQTKPMTATALMMLVDEGRVDLDDPVERYLPEFTGQWLIVERDDTHQVLQKPPHPITLRNILAHTSGMPFKSALEELTLDTLPLRVAVRSYAMTPLQFLPGSRYEYSNTGINTVGRIIEVVSGQAYEDFLEQRLLAPLGMRDTTFRPTAEQLTRLAKSYRPTAADTDLEAFNISQLQHPLNAPGRYPIPAGGLFSTAADVALFCQMILNGGLHAGTRLVSESAIAEMTRKQTGEAVEVGHGLGWFTDKGVFWHGGALSTNMTIDPGHNLITVFLVQHAGFPGTGGTCHSVFTQQAIERFG